MYRVFFDGACAGNPGPIGIGVSLVCPDGEELDTYHAYMGEGTNNKAEYMALLAAVEMIKKHRLANVTIFGDSQLVIKQVTGAYKCNSTDLVPYRDRAQLELNQMENARLKWIPRAENIRADELSKLGLEQRGKQPTPLATSTAQQSASQLFDEEPQPGDMNVIYHPGIGFSVIENEVLHAINLRPLSCSCSEAGPQCRHIKYVFNFAKLQRKQ